MSVRPFLASTRAALSTGLLASVLLLGPAMLVADPSAGAQTTPPAPAGLEIYFVDTEGGAATLIVTPAGESVLIDSGNPGERDAGRIAEAARLAGVTEISHYITTHWHSDHVGGIGTLAATLPVRQVYGHQVPDPLPGDVNADLMAAWKALSAEPHVLAAGNTIELKGKRGTPTPKIRVLAADALVAGEKPGAPHTTTCADGHEARPEDTSDNARSLALHLTFGTFDLFAGGDLTWNIEHKLACPRRVAPKVDVFLVNHHGADSSNHPALLAALQPEVAIVNNGPRKGGEPRTIAQLQKQVGDVGLFQLHRNVRPGAVNAESARIANDQEACKGVPLRLRVDPGGGRYVVYNPTRDAERAYSSR